MLAAAAYLVLWCGLRDYVQAAIGLTTGVYSRKPHPFPHTPLRALREKGLVNALYGVCSLRQDFGGPIIENDVNN